ncbi:hypothetical protein AGMMS49587_19750 [Spirochaetia bacterium]|nr:hypothetical protein AGMMS49587_19750 [Spirochaetia bacterium]
MNNYEPVIMWELTRAASSIAAWWVLFYHMHRPPTLWRRIALLVAMPAAYIFWILTPMSVLQNAVSWALFPWSLLSSAVTCADPSLPRFSISGWKPP